MSAEQSFVTIVIPFADGTEWAGLRFADVERAIEALGNPAHDQVSDRLTAESTVHFASIHAIPPEEPGRSPHLLIEATVDGTIDSGVRALARALAADLLPVLAMVSGIAREGEVVSLLLRHSRSITPNPLNWPGQIRGLPFNGLPGLSVATILRNDRIVAAAAKLIHEKRAADSWFGPQTIFQLVDCELRKTLADDLRRSLERPGPKLSFVETRDAPWLAIERGTIELGWVGKSLWEARQVLAVVLGLPYVLSAILLALGGATWVTALLAGIAPALLLAAVTVFVLVRLLMRDEAANTPLDATPDPQELARMMARENAPGVVHNHMMSLTRLRPAAIRRLSLSVGFHSIRGFIRLRMMRSGFLAGVGTIHAARWIVLPGTRQLLFLSNYDGSWESYLEDFITKSPGGITGVWSNAAGFPQTTALYWKGATDGDRMKRYARNSMRPTPFWFSAYPALTTTVIRKQALIVSGLHCHERVGASPSDAEAWLDLFSTIPRPDYGLQYGEIQTLMFGGLRRHPHSRLIGFDFGDPREPDIGGAHPYRHVQDWLAELDRKRVIAFGDKPPEELVGIVAFSPAGLAKLGLDVELGRDRADAGAAQGFPAAFALGMADPTRKRVLGDPATLAWTEDTAHAVLLLYARDEVAAESFAAEVRRAEKFGLKRTIEIDTGLRRFDTDKFEQAWNHDDKRSPFVETAQSANPAENFELTQEPFGFVDGISQPLVRGFPGRHGAPDPIHAMEPGEFILGYADNRGYFPPSPLVARALDDIGMEPDAMLPSPPLEQPSQYPDFTPQGVTARDFGRNGSYLVIRQLKQDVDGFTRQIARMGEEICAKTDAANPHPRNLFRTREWLAAKLVGRWRDGSSLVDHPFQPAFLKDAETVAANDFLYRDADPQGQRCPFGSHVRRAFPRDSLGQTIPTELSVTNRHRLLRRGRPFVGEDGELAGTLFMCFNADLERQFEFVQQTWIGSPAFHGLAGEVDPFALHRQTQPRTGEPVPGGPFTIPGRGVPRVEEVARLVTLLGGGYYFMPGRRSLWFLAGKSWRDDLDLAIQLPPAV